jgi:hypothetical protein
MYLAPSDFLPSYTTFSAKHISRISDGGKEQTVAVSNKELPMSVETT